MVEGSKRDRGTDKIKILVVDGHAIVRRGLAKLVEDERGLTVGAEAENAGQALEAIKNQQFDMAVVNASLEGINGFELTSKIKSLYPNMTVLILSVYDGLLYARRALQAGAGGYVAKYEAPEKIISAIHQVLAGKVYVSNSSAHHI
jgi:DNA-binding NarL/FixJ family response regulator